ncbi:hypothetical protein ABT144_34315 [Streptomyces sp. NPDC002039]|uniref:hypothetical protein n=1 Tax=Streptomyces sp. NPDC002039 TaxID=3154660 RepID=UPI00332C155C
MPSAEASVWPAQEAADEVKRVMLGAGIKLAQPRAKREGEKVIALFAAHDKTSSLSVLRQGYGELADRGWKPSKNSQEGVLRYEKEDCAVMSLTSFELRPPDLRPGDDLISVTVVCTMH